MRRTLRLSYVISSLAVVGTLVGCGSSADESSAPPPNEPVVFTSSAETKSDLGIVRWGFMTESTSDFTRYRGYDDKNNVVAEVTQDLDRSNPDVYHFVMKLTGTGGSASEKIDFTAGTAENGVDGLLITTVIENTFDDGSFGQKVLLAFQKDAQARTSSTTVSGNGSLVGQSHPLDGNQLVTNCNQTVNTCQTELIDSRIAASSQSSECGLLKRVGLPLLACVGGAAGGALLTIWGGPTALVGGAIGCGTGAAPVTAGQEISCASARRDATKAAQDLKTCQDNAKKSCQ